MSDLKPMYDAALAADAEVKRIKNEMLAHFNAGTEEGKQKALEMRPELEAAQAKSEESNKLYASVRDAGQTTDNAAALFTTPSDPAANDQGKESAKVMKRSEYNALQPRDRLAFAKAGGKLED